MEIKEKLVVLRKEKGLTQLAVAEKLDVSRQAISRWESGMALPSTDNLRCLSSLYEVPIDYLLKEDSKRKSDSDNEPAPDKIRHKNKKNGCSYSRCSCRCFSYWHTLLFSDTS